MWSTPKIVLLTTALASQVLVFASWYASGALTDPQVKDRAFGRIVDPRLRTYFTVTAGTCLVLTWACIGLFLTSTGTTNARVLLVAACVLVYNGLQTLFFRGVEDASTERGKTPLRVLLAACVLPIAGLFVVSVFESTAAAVTSGLVLFHVLVHDAIVFGRLF